MKDNKPATWVKPYVLSYVEENSVYEEGIYHRLYFTTEDDKDFYAAIVREKITDDGEENAKSEFFLESFEVEPIEYDGGEEL